MEERQRMSGEASDEKWEEESRNGGKKRKKRRKGSQIATRAKNHMGNGRWKERCLSEFFTVKLKYVA